MHMYIVYIYTIQYFKQISEYIEKIGIISEKKNQNKIGLDYRFPDSLTYISNFDPKKFQKIEFRVFKIQIWQISELVNIGISDPIFTPSSISRVKWEMGLSDVHFYQVSAMAILLLRFDLFYLLSFCLNCDFYGDFYGVATLGEVRQYWREDTSLNWK